MYCRHGTNYGPRKFLKSRYGPSLKKVGCSCSKLPRYLGYHFNKDVTMRSVYQYASKTYRGYRARDVLVPGGNREGLAIVRVVT